MFTTPSRKSTSRSGKTLTSAQKSSFKPPHWQTWSLTNRSFPSSHRAQTIKLPRLQRRSPMQVSLRSLSVLLGANNVYMRTRKAWSTEISHRSFSSSSIKESQLASLCKVILPLLLSRPSLKCLTQLQFKGRFMLRLQNHQIKLMISWIRSFSPIWNRHSFKVRALTWQRSWPKLSRQLNKLMMSAMLLYSRITWSLNHKQWQQSQPNKYKYNLSQFKPKFNLLFSSN